jgi:hypothetical protein
LQQGCCPWQPLFLSSLYCLALSALSQCLFIGKIFKVVPFYKPQKIDYIERESDKTNNPI